MNRNNGLFAGMLVALTLFGVSSRQEKNPENPTQGSAAKTRSSLPATPPEIRKSVPYSPCKEIAKRLRRFAKDPSVPLESWRLPDSSYETGGTRSQVKRAEFPADVHFAIATVPDPVSTHLPLLFDRIVEATQQAVQDNDYSYDTSWFPWDTSEKNYQLLADQRAQDELEGIRESQPGVMVFRRAINPSARPYEGGLVIFLVGEQPTGGIRDEQFEHALDWISQLGGLDDPRTLSILGPTFSGTLPSLQRALAQRNFGRRVTLRISSGTVSSRVSANWFGASVAKWGVGSYFRTAMESDSLLVKRFCQYLHDQGYDVNRIAFLSEDETAFGRGTAVPKPVASQTACSGAIDLYYPRDIATLRSAYQQQSVLNSGRPATKSTTPSTTLRGDLSEPSNGNHDTVRTYGGQLTPLAQEAVLLDIVNRLNQQEIQFVVLRSTNSLDQIFLSQFLRRSYPSGRLVIDGADLLFNRGTEGRALRGVMMLSPYPLLPVGQDWTSSLLTPRKGGYRTFAEDTSEAVYIAARELFADSPPHSQIPIHDYAPPAWASNPDDRDSENRRPATWISVIGRRQFWPLAVLNSYTMRNPHLTGTLATSLDRGDGPLIPVDKKPLHLPTVMWIVLFVCFGWSLVHFYFCWKGSVMGSPRALAFFAPTDRRQHSVLTALGSVMLAMLAVAVAAASGIFSFLFASNPFQDSVKALLAACLLFLTLAVALAAYIGNSRMVPLSASSVPQKNTKRWREVVAAATLVGLGAFSLIQISLLLHLTAANRIPVYWRSLNIFSGVSPLLPELLLLAGGYFWFWCTLRGLAHFGVDRPLLPRIADLPMSESKTSRMPMFSWDHAGLAVENEAVPLNRRYLIRLLAIFTVTTGVAAIALQGIWIRTLGERAFGSLIFFWICLCISVILTDGVQTWRAWSQLRQLLVHLDRLPLRRTLRSLKGLAWGSIWKMGGNVLEERYRVMSFQAECLRHLTNTVAEWSGRESASVRSGALPLAIADCRLKLLKLAGWYAKIQQNEPIADLKPLREFQEQLAATAGAVMTNILLPAWEKEKKSLIFGRPDGKPGEGKSGSDISTDDLPAHVRVAEEFFVLPYLAFIQNILGRFRTLALGSLWLFVGATLAISSYPFDPLNVLGAIFLTVFVIVGGLTILVYSQMSRDASLSHITNTNPGELGFDFWVRLLGFGIGPLIGLLTTLFPSITDFALSWLQPSVEALK
ncbi:MAG: hypothetical protein ABI822_04520 [Bryobacteraceae bacterium]